MTIISKFPISTGDGKGGRIVIPKGTKGSLKGVSNSPKIRAAFPDLEHKVEGWFLICSFPGFIDEILCDKTQVDVE